VFSDVLTQIITNRIVFLLSKIKDLYTQILGTKTSNYNFCQHLIYDCNLFPQNELLDLFMYSELIEK